MTKQRFLLSFFVFLFPYFSYADSTLVSFGAAWKYFDAGSLPDSAWADTTYDDSAWPSGNAELGYGDGDETTVVSFGGNASNKFITTYFRNSITVNNISSFTSFQLNVKRDDGVVVYVNGLEVFRDNMPTGAIGYDTLASTSAADDGDVAQTVLIPASFFADGINTIAAEIHQVDTSSSDISFDLQLKAFGAYVPFVLRQPYLQLLAPEAITVRWRTDVPAYTKVCYGIQPGVLPDCVMDSALVTDHELRLTNLIPNTTYYYSISDGTTVLQGDSSHYFTTAPLAGSAKPTRLWLLGDAGVNALQQNNVRDAFLNYNNNQPLDFLIMLGDNAYNSGTDQEYQDAVFQNHYEDILKHLPVVSTAGNHENYTADALAQTGPYYDIFSLPKNAEAGGVPSGSEAYYSFDYGNIHFVCLETNTPSLLQPGSAMLSWLATDLAATNQKWKVVYFHNPPYTKGGHDSDTETDLIEIRQNIVPILEQYSTDLVLNGHSHVYERSYMLYGHYGLSSSIDSSMVIDFTIGQKPAPLIKRNDNNYKGTVYVQAGISGVVESVRPDWPHPAMRFVNNVNLGSLLLTVINDTLTLKCIDDNVSSPGIIDDFSIVKTCNVVPVFNPVAPLCISNAAVTLSATPAGGYFSGPGVTDSVFNPATAGGGIHTLTYTYSDQYACNVNATIQVQVVSGVPSQPSLITGPSLVCPPVNDVSLYIPAQTDASSYSWAVSAGTSGVSFTTVVNDTAVSLNITNSNPSYTLEVAANNLCGASTPGSITMNRVKNFPVTLYGSQQACPLDTNVYNTYGLTAIATYAWSASAGALINNQPSPVTTTNINQVSVVFPSGFSQGAVCVASHPACLKNIGVKCVTVSSTPQQPANITGPGSVVPGTQNVSFSINAVAGATGYLWSLPANALLVTGQNTTTITVDFTASYTGGIISVQALTDCGQSVPVNKLVKVFTFFSANNIQNTDRIYSGGNTHGDNVLSIQVSPNPVIDNLTVAFKGEDATNRYEIEITDISGKTMSRFNGKISNGNTRAVIPLSILSKGVYLIKITTPLQQHYQRIIKN